MTSRLFQSHVQVKYAYKNETTYVKKLIDDKNP